MATIQLRPRGLALVRSTKIRLIPTKTLRTDRVDRTAGVTVGRRPGVASPTAWPADRPILHDESPMSGLVLEATAIAFQVLDLLERYAREVAADFRKADVASAQRGLCNLVQSTRTLLRLAALAAHVKGTNIRALCHDMGSTADRQAQDALDQVTALLVSRDWAELAVLLERDYHGTLAEWRTIFGTLAESTFEPDPDGCAA